MPARAGEPPGQVNRWWLFPQACWLGACSTSAKWPWERRCATSKATGISSASARVRLCICALVLPGALTLPCERRPSRCEPGPLFSSGTAATRRRAARYAAAGATVCCVQCPGGILIALPLASAGCKLYGVHLTSDKHGHAHKDAHLALRDVRDSDFFFWCASAGEQSSWIQVRAWVKGRQAVTRVTVSGTASYET